MQRHHVFVTAAALAACAGGAPRAEPVVGSSAAHTVQTGPVAAAPPLAVSAGCPGRTFATFLAAYAERPALQRRFTRFPLASSDAESGDGGPESAVRALLADSVRGPLSPSAAERARDSLQVRVDSARSDRRVVTLCKPDTDYQLAFTFERRADACWELTGYDDQSL